MAAVLRVDHVVMAVADLDRASAWLDGFGLASEPGGIHPRWGTANRIAPLGATYLELLGIVDGEVARGTVLGRALAERAQGGDRWFAMCLADEDIDATAQRLDMPVEAGARTKPDGSEVRWRGAGIEDPRRTLGLPFFIAWDTPDGHPGRMPIVHPAGEHAIGAIELGGDEAAFHAWTGDGLDVPLRFVHGPPGIRAVVLENLDGAIRLEGAPDRSR